MSEAVNAQDIILAAGSVGEIAKESGLSNAMAYFLIVMAIIMFLSMITLITILIREILGNKKNKIEVILQEVALIREDFKNTIKAFEENQMAIVGIFGEHRDHIEDKINKLKEETTERITELKETIDCKKDIDSKTFELFATNIFHIAIYNIERDVSKIIDRNNLYSLQTMLLGSDGQNGEIYNRVNFRIEEASTHLRDISYSDKLKKEVITQINEEKTQLVKALCNIVTVEAQEVIDDKKKSILKRYAENVTFEYRNNFQKRIKSIIFILGGQ